MATLSPLRNLDIFVDAILAYKPALIEPNLGCTGFFSVITVSSFGCFVAIDEVEVFLKALPKLPGSNFSFIFFVFSTVFSGTDLVFLVLVPSILATIGDKIYSS